MKKLEYSQIARRKLKELRIHLTNEYGPAVSGKIIKQITTAARGLESFEKKEFLSPLCMESIVTTAIYT